MTAEGPTVRDLVLARTDDHAPGLVTAAGTMSWAEHTRAAASRAHWLLDRDLAEPGHVGVLLDATAEFSLLLAAGALAGVPLVGLNPTRTGPALARDVVRTSCRVVVTSSAHRPLLDGLDGLPPVVEVDDPSWQHEVASSAPSPPSIHVAASDTFMLVLTSGTTGAPKAVVCSQGRIAAQGATVASIASLGPGEVTYCAMPLFHSNGLIAGWTATVASGATLALRPTFSASAFLDDVRRVGASYANYVGTPLSYVLATDERDDDADNPLRLVFGNEAAPHDVARFAERFDCRVVEAYGSTEGGISVVRTDRTPPGALGVPIGDVHVVDPDTGHEKATAEFHDDGRLANPAAAIGEMVRTDGVGAFEGYWDAPDAEADRLRDGWFWSGDLAFRDADGFLWFAGRRTGWLRVGGENVAAAPVERILLRHPEVIEAAVFGVAHPTAGEEVAAAVAVPGELDVGEFAAWLDAQPDLGSTWSPVFLRVVDRLPQTATNKVDRGALTRTGLATDVLVRDGPGFRRYTDEDRDRRRSAFREAGRIHLLSTTS